MTNLKQYLKQFLEAEPKFKDAHIENVLKKIEEKQKKKATWMPQILTVSLVVSVIAALLFLRPNEPSPLLTVEQPIESDLLGFQAYINDYVEQKDESVIIYSLENFQQEHQTLVISTSPSKKMFLVSVHVKEGNTWRLYAEQGVIDERLHVTGEGPYLYTGIIKRDEVRAVVIGNEQSPIIRFDDATIEGVMFVQLKDTNSLPVVIDYATSPAERLFTQHNTFKNQIELVEASDAPLFTYDESNMHIEADEYSKLPLVIRENPTIIKKWDVVLIDDGVNEPYISRIIGLPESKIAMQNGTVIENDQVMHTYFGSVKINGYTNLYSYEKAFRLSTKEADDAKRMFNYEMDPIELAPTQYFVMSDNLAQSIPTIIEAQYIKGLVQGYDAQSMAGAWSEQEKVLYAKLKASKKKSDLKELEPIEIARLFLYAKYLADSVMEHFFLTTSPNMEQISLDQYVTENKGVTTSRLMEWYYTLTRLTENATIEQIGIGGTIVLEENMYNNSDLKMIYNENGYWEMAYEFIQQK